MQANTPRQADLLVVPAFDFTRSGDIDQIVSRLGPELAMIRKAARGQTVASICGGAFLLAEAGILVGRKATTAWAMAEVFMRRYPSTRLDPKAIMVRDGGIITSGAFTAYGDLALSVVKEHAGADIARATARFSLISTTRNSQAPFIDAGSMGRNVSSFGREVEHWLAAHITSRYNLDEAAQAFGLSSRTFLRRVKSAMGRTPLDVLQDLRVEQAKRLLEITKLGVGEIADRVGYQDVPSFHRLFQRKLSMTPATYRRQFHSGG